MDKNVYVLLKQHEVSKLGVVLSNAIAFEITLK